MAFFLKKTRNKKGLYLQIYESYYDPQRRQTAHRSVKPLGYEHELQAHGIADPIGHFKLEIERLNQQQNQQQQPKTGSKTQPQIGKHSPLLKQGFFPLAAIDRGLEITQILDIINMHHDLGCDVIEILHDFVYANALGSGSFQDSYERVLPQMKEEAANYSFAQVVPAIAFLGSYSKQIVAAYTQQLQERKVIDSSVSYCFYNNCLSQTAVPADLPLTTAPAAQVVVGGASLAILLDKNHLPVALEVFTESAENHAQLTLQIGNARRHLGLAGRTIHVSDQTLAGAEHLQAVLAQGDGMVLALPLAQLSTDDMSRLLDLSRFTHVSGTPGEDGEYVQEVSSACGTIFQQLGQQQKQVVVFSELLRRQDLANRSEAAGMAGYRLYATSELDLPTSEFIGLCGQHAALEAAFSRLQQPPALPETLHQQADMKKGQALISYLSLLLTRLLQDNILAGKYPAAEITRFMQEFMLFPKSKNIYLNVSPASEVLAELAAILALPLLNLNLTRKNVQDMQQAKLYLQPKS